MQATRIAQAQFRTKVGNGSSMFLDAKIDGRTNAARRFQEVFATIIQDIGGDPTEAQIQIARRAATLAIWSESLEAKLAMGADLDVATYTTAANSQRRLLESLGLKRIAKDITSGSLDDYLASKANAAPAHPLATDTMDDNEVPDADTFEPEEFDNFADEPEGAE